MINPNPPKFEYTEEYLATLPSRIEWDKMTQEERDARCLKAFAEDCAKWGCD